MPRFPSPPPGLYEKFRLPSPVKTPWPENNVVPFLYFPPDPRVAPAPAAVVLHGYRLSKDLFAPIGPHLRRAGWAGLILDLPFHGERATPTASGEIFPFGGHLDHYVTTARQMVADVVRCLGWLKQRREVDPHRSVVLGFSLGGIVASLLMGLGVGLSAGVSLMAAGDWADLIFTAPLASESRAALERAGVSLGEAREAFREVSASSYASAVRHLLVVGGRRDELVPRVVIEAFWQRIDHNTNRMVWKDSGHIPPLRSTAREVLSFLREKLRPSTPGKEVLVPRDDRRPNLTRAGCPRFPLSPL